MYEQLAKSIGEKVSTTEEFELCKLFFIPKNYVKNKPYLKARYLFNAFVEKGVLRSYSTDDKGNDNTAICF
jgi:hypothetical protein